MEGPSGVASSAAGTPQTGRWATAMHGGLYAGLAGLNKCLARSKTLMDGPKATRTACLPLLKIFYRSTAAW